MSFAHEKLWELVMILAYLSLNADISPETAYAISWSSIHYTSVAATPHPC